MLDNQGFRPKSEVSEKEREEFARYREGLLALCPINSMERANALRTFLAQHFECCKRMFVELKLPH